MGDAGAMKKMVPIINSWEQVHFQPPFLRHTQSHRNFQVLLMSSVGVGGWGEMSLHIAQSGPQGWATLNTSQG